MKVLLFLLLSLICVEGSATLHPPPCTFGLQGELLIFKATQEQTDFATLFNSDVDLNGKSINNQIGFKPGFRIEAAYAFDCLHEIHGRFTHFTPDHTKRISGVMNISGTSITDSFDAESKLEMNYYNAELLWCRGLYDCPDFDFSWQVGLEYSYFRSTINNFYSPINLTGTFFGLRDRSTFWGLGPEIVLDLDYPFSHIGCGALSICANLRGALLASQTKFNNTLTTATTSTHFRAPSFWRVTPLFDARLGLNWLLPFKCFTASFEVGYEWLWMHFVANKNFPRVSIGNQVTFPTINNFSDVTFQGPYIALSLAF